MLQEDIPETTIADFREYAGKFVAEVRKNHARPGLVHDMCDPRLGWISIAEIQTGLLTSLPALPLQRLHSCKESRGELCKTIARDGSNAAGRGLLEKKSPTRPDCGPKRRRRYMSGGK